MARAAPGQERAGQPGRHSQTPPSERHKFGAFNPLEYDCNQVETVERSGGPARAGPDGAGRGWALRFSRKALD